MKSIHAQIFLLTTITQLWGCRASFEDIQRQNLVASDNLTAKKNLNEDPNPVLENEKSLPRDQSPTYDCLGVVVVTERGRDINRDGVLQPTEVEEIQSECKLDPPDTSKPSDSCDMASQSKAGECPDSPQQNDPGQSK